MPFNTLDHHRTLPVLLNSHQLHDVSTTIHELVTAAFSPDNPRYQPLVSALQIVQQNMSRLNVAHTHRPYKDTKNLRPIGSVDGKTGEDALTARKYRIYTERKTLLSRFRQYIQLQLLLDTRPEATAAATLLTDLLNKRIPRFERKSYAESTLEFAYFFENVEASADALEALNTLDLATTFDQLKSLQNAFNDLRRQHTELAALREQQPKVTPSADELRQSVSAILSFLHFDIDTGANTFKPVLAHIDEIIDKQLTVARARKTPGSAPAPRKFCRKWAQPREVQTLKRPAPTSIPKALPEMPVPKSPSVCVPKEPVLNVTP